MLGNFTCINDMINTQTVHSSRGKFMPGHILLEWNKLWKNKDIKRFEWSTKVYAMQLIIR